MVAGGVEDVEFEIGQERANELPGKEQLKFVVTHVDHVALQAAEVVAFKAALAGSEDAVTKFRDERLGPEAST